MRLMGGDVDNEINKSEINHVRNIARVSLQTRKPYF